MTFPDWGMAISSEAVDFMAWSAVATPVQILLGVMIGAAALVMVMGVIQRGR